MQKITKNNLETGTFVFEQFNIFCTWYPNGLDVCWMCFREAMYNDIDMQWFCRYLEYGDRIFVEKHTVTKMVRVKCCIGGLTPKMMSVIDHHGLKRMEKAFLEKTSLGDFYYRRRLYDRSSR